MENNFQEPSVITKTDSMAIYKKPENYEKYKPLLDIYVNMILDGEPFPKKKFKEKYGLSVLPLLKRGDCKQYIAQQLAEYIDIEEDRLQIYQELKAIAFVSAKDVTPEKIEQDAMVAKAVQAYSYNRETGEFQVKLHNKLGALAQLSEITKMTDYSEPNKAMAKQKRLFDEDL
jgi:hypothetical protein